MSQCCFGQYGMSQCLMHCTMQCAQSHVSIPSHCTIGRGWDRMGCPTMYHAVCPIPCVHPVPLYHWEGMGPNGMSHHVPCSVPNPMCPSRPIVPLGGDGTSWDVLQCTMQCTQSHVSIRPIVPLGGDGNGWDVSQCPMQSKNGTE